MELFALDNDHKLQYNDVVVHWVQYPFHDDVIVKSTLLSSSSPSANEPLAQCTIYSFSSVEAFLL